MDAQFNPPQEIIKAKDKDKRIPSSQKPEEKNYT